MSFIETLTKPNLLKEQRARYIEAAENLTRLAKYPEYEAYTSSLKSLATAILTRLLAEKNRDAVLELQAQWQLISTILSIPDAAQLLDEATT